MVMVRTDRSFICNGLNGTLRVPMEKSDESADILKKGSCVSNVHLVESSKLSEISQCTAMSKFIETSNPTEQYNEDPLTLYGYISAINYGLSTSPKNQNTYGTMQSDHEAEITIPESEYTSEKVTNYHNGSEKQNQISQIVLHPLLRTSQILESNDVFVGGISTEVGSATKWRSPNLSEVISFLHNPNSAIKANAAAYLQHLCYMDDPNKQRTRTLGGIPPLVGLLSSEIYEVHKNACGALRNLSYGRQNDENKRAIKNAGGISALINLLCRATEIELKELITGIIWNMSSCEDLKRHIIDDGLNAIVMKVIKPNSGWDPVCPGDACFSTVFRNASGVLRNVSSAGEFARTMLRNSECLVECLLYVVRTSIERNNIGTKIVENCVCILRNLSYRCQEVEDSNYDKFVIIAPNISPAKGENLGCFGTSKKKRESILADPKTSISSSSITSSSSISKSLPTKGCQQLWQPDIVHYYLALLQSCSNPETLEAAAGALQNLTACYWQPSVDVRAAVRKEKGLPILVELLRMEVDKVVCAVATALRNLAIDERNKELIGKYAMRDLIQKLPLGNPQHDMGTSDETISAVLATINEVIKKSPEFARSLLEADGVERLLNVSGNRHQFTSCVLKFSDQVLLTMWQHNELRDVYKKHGWKEQDFVTKNIAARSSVFSHHNNANNTLNRPMASQSHTRYEDKTIHRTHNNSEENRNIGKFSAAHESTKLYQRAKNDASHYSLQRGKFKHSTEEISSQPN